MDGRVWNIPESWAKFREYGSIAGSRWSNQWSESGEEMGSRDIVISSVPVSVRLQWSPSNGEYGFEALLWKLWPKWMNCNWLSRTKNAWQSGNPKVFCQILFLLPDQVQADLFESCFWDIHKRWVGKINSPRRGAWKAVFGSCQDHWGSFCPIKDWSLTLHQTIPNQEIFSLPGNILRCSTSQGWTKYSLAKVTCPCPCLACWFNFSCCFLLFFRENVLNFFVWHIWPYSKLYLPTCIGNIRMPKAPGLALTWPPHTIFWSKRCQNTIYNTLLIQQYTKYNIQDTIFRSHRCQNQLGVRSCGHCPVSAEILDGQFQLNTYTWLTNRRALLWNLTSKSVDQD